jgi:sulfide dehydrogenase [flavocytochrome c] flavoprotein chain
MLVSRRNFGKLIGTSALTWGLGANTRALYAAGKPRVVVIGGGPGGATAARYIAKDSKGAIDVTLIEPKSEFTTCFFSNLYVGGYRSLESITHSYAKLASEFGITHLKQNASSVDRAAKAVTLADGSVVPYDRLVVTPGIALKYKSIPGYSKEASEALPHAWAAGPQTTLLKNKLEAVPDGGLVVMLAPPNPYRCPPGPYERISMFAHVLKAQGKSKCKIVIIDPKDKFSKQAVFIEGWQKHYPGMIEWLGPDVHGGVKSVDAATNTVVTGLETYKADLVNAIPAQRAGAIASRAGLTDDKGWCPVNPETMQSKYDPNVHVLGDACIGGDMPKSAFSANSQAKVAAMQIRAALLGSEAFPAKYANTCWSLVETDDCIKIGAVYAPKDGKITAGDAFVSKPGEDAALRKQNAEEAVGWYAGITADIWG